MTKYLYLFLALLFVGCDVESAELQTGDSSCSTSDGRPCFCGTAGCDGGDPASGGGTGGGGGGGGGGSANCTYTKVCNNYGCQRANLCGTPHFYPRNGWADRLCYISENCSGRVTTGPAFSEQKWYPEICEPEACQ